MKGMILAAGKGSRLRPLTDKIPKPLIHVGEHKMLDITLAYLRKYGVDDVVINVHHLSGQIKSYVEGKRKEGYKIEISEEDDLLLDTGGGLKKASWFFKNTTSFVLAACDIVTDLNLGSMIKFHNDSDALVTLAVKERKTSRSLLFDNIGYLSGWKHNETGEVKMVSGKNGVRGFGFSGFHVINARIFDLMAEEGIFSIIDLYLRLAENYKVMAFEHKGPWFEFGRIINIEEHSQNANFKAIVDSFFLNQ